MELGYSCNSASGPSWKNCHCLVYRYPEERGFQPDCAESYVVEWTDDGFHTRMMQVGWMTSLWRAPSERVYVTDSSGAVAILSEAPTERNQFTEHRLRGVLTGVWGLDDSNVWVWGRRGADGVVYHFDGTRFTEIPSPGRLLCIHGVSPDLLFAVGERGLVARWDGHAWHKYPPVSTALLSSVWVESPDEVYASGKGKEIWDGSVNGWSLRYRHGSPLGGIAKWQDRVFVACGGDFGLSELVGNQLESRKPNILSTLLDARDELLITCPTLVAGTADGENYKGRGLEVIADVLADKPPRW